MRKRRMILVALAVVALSRCATVDYGAMEYSTVPSVGGCPDSGSACSKGRG